MGVSCLQWSVSRAECCCVSSGRTAGARGQSSPSPHYHRLKTSISSIRLELGCCGISPHGHFHLVHQNHFCWFNSVNLARDYISAWNRDLVNSILLRCTYYISNISTVWDTMFNVHVYTVIVEQWNAQPLNVAALLLVSWRWCCRWCWSPADPDPDVEHICGQNIFLVAVHKKSPLQLSSPCCRHMPGPRVRSCKTSSDHNLSKNILTFL